MRFFKELRQPKLKCDRVGHKEKTREYSGYEPPCWDNRWSAVADVVKGTIRYCARCGEQFDRTVESRRGIQGLTMDKARHDEMNEKGFVE